MELLDSVEQAILHDLRADPTLAEWLPHSAEHFGMKAGDDGVAPELPVTITVNATDEGEVTNAPNSGVRLVGIEIEIQVNVHAAGDPKLLGDLAEKISDRVQTTREPAFNGPTLTVLGIMSRAPEKRSDEDLMRRRVIVRQFCCIEAKATPSYPPNCIPAAPPPAPAATSQKFVCSFNGSVWTVTSGAGTITGQSSTTLTVSAPSSYFVARIFGLICGGTGISALALQFNGDAAANYNYRRNQATAGNTMAIVDTSGATSLLCASSLFDATPIEIWIPGYSIAGRTRGVLSSYGSYPASKVIGNHVGTWLNTTDAISSITLVGSSGAGAFVSGDAFEFVFE